MADLKLDTRRLADVTLLGLNGYINAHTVKEFETYLVQLLEGGDCRIIINGKGLQYIASAGLGALMGVIEDIREKQGDIRLCELSPSVYEVFDILGFTHLFRIFPTEEEAVRSFSD